MIRKEIYQDWSKIKGHYLCPASEELKPEPKSVCRKRKEFCMVNLTRSEHDNSVVVLLMDFSEIFSGNLPAVFSKRTHNPVAQLTSLLCGNQMLICSSSRDCGTSLLSYLI